MEYTYDYASPLGTLRLVSDEQSLMGIYFEGEYCPRGAAMRCTPEGMPPVLRETEAWLDEYFAGREPKGMPRLRLEGTPFRQHVWALLLQIPYGEMVTYGALARRLALELGKGRMSAQAVGGAVGHNPVSILVPCHRVIGSGGNLTGYAGGLERKVRLLELEGVDMSQLYLPPRALYRE